MRTKHRSLYSPVLDSIASEIEMTTLYTKIMLHNTSNNALDLIFLKTIYKKCFHLFVAAPRQARGSALCKLVVRWMPCKIRGYAACNTFSIGGIFLSDTTPSVPQIT